MKRLILAITVTSALLFTSCAPKLGGNDYDAKSVGEISTTLRGKVIAVRQVKIHAKNPSELGTGAIVGGVTGALLGSTIGNGSGSTVGAVVGSVAAGAAGHVLEQKMTEQEGFEYQIELDQGEVITITQGVEPSLGVGQKVLVIKSSSGRSRVVPDQT